MMRDELLRRRRRDWASMRLLVHVLWVHALRGAWLSRRAEECCATIVPHPRRLVVGAPPPGSVRHADTSGACILVCGELPRFVVGLAGRGSRFSSFFLLFFFVQGARKCSGRHARHFSCDRAANSRPQHPRFHMFTALPSTTIAHTHTHTASPNCAAYFFTRSPCAPLTA